MAKLWEKQYTTVQASKPEIPGHPIKLEYFAKITGVPSMEVLTQTLSYSNLVAGVVKLYAIHKWPSALLLKSVNASPALTSLVMFEQPPDLRIFAISVTVMPSDHSVSFNQTAAKPYTLGLPNRIVFAGFIATIHHTLEVNCYDANLYLGDSTLRQQLKKLSLKTVKRHLSLAPEILSDLLTPTGNLTYGRTKKAERRSRAAVKKTR